MNTKNKPAILYSTFPNKQSAEKTASHLLKHQHAACVNLIPNILAIYQWEDKVQRDQEVAMIIKTRVGKTKDAMECVLDTHPYDTPALLVINVEEGNQAYLDWICQSTSKI